MSNKFQLKLNLKEIRLFIGWFLCFTPPLLLRVSSLLASLIRYGGIIYIAFLFVTYKPQKIRMTRKNGYFYGAFIAFLIWTIGVVFFQSSKYLLSFLKSDILPMAEMVILLFLSTSSKSAIPQDKIWGLNVLHHLMWVYLIMNFLSIIFFPRGIIRSAIGASVDRANWVLGSKNNQAIYLTLIVSFICLYNTGSNNKKWGFLGIFVALFCAAFTGSNGIQFLGGSSVGIFSVLFILIAYILSDIQNKNIFNIRFIYIYLIICLVNLIVLNIRTGFFTKLLSTFTGIFHKDITFSNRVYFWESVKRYIFNNPWIGYGEQQVNFLSSSVFSWSSESTYTYNLFLKIIFSFGFVGFALMSIIFVQLPKVEKDSQYTILIASMICVFVNGLMNEIRFHYLFLFPFIIMMIYGGNSRLKIIKKRRMY